MSAFHLDERVVLDYQGRKITGTIKRLYPEFHDAVRVEDDRGLEYLAAGSDVTSYGQWERMKEIKRVEAVREKYLDVIEAWQGGNKTPAAVAAALKITPQAAANKIRACKRHSLLRP